MKVTKDMLEKAVAPLMPLYRAAHELERSLMSTTQDLGEMTANNAALFGSVRENPTPTLHLVRGLPGSGKSTFAHTLGVLVFEADDWFLRQDPTIYAFRPQELYLAHRYCRERTFLALAAGEDVAVANTFVSKQELDEYLRLAKGLGARVVIHKCTGRFGNVHGVPDEIVARMSRQWEDVEGEIPR